MAFPAPVESFDIHVYFFQDNPSHVASAQQLRDNLAANFPQLKVYQLIPRPVGPHATGMFQAILKNSQEFGQVVPWLMLHRGTHSVLVHPHTGNELQDHLQHAIWIGEKMPVDPHKLL